MDGSRVTVAVYGGKEVGKTTFIAHCLELYKTKVCTDTTAVVNICGRDVTVTVIRNPEELTSAQVAIVLIDLTFEDALSELPGSLDRAKRLSPTAVTAVVATKADLYRLRKLNTEDAVRFCESWTDGPLPYYEIGLDPPDSISFAFQEILGRPLIDEYLRNVTTQPELSSFIHKVMDWCLENGSANLLSHLRSFGHPVPPSLFTPHTHVLSEYFFTQRPPLPIPEFTKNDLSIAPETRDYEDTLDEPEEPLQVVDTRPAISLSPSHHLSWDRLSLTVFPPQFLLSPSLSSLPLSHVDLSHNKLTKLPLQLFLLTYLKYLNVSYNHLPSLPPVESWASRSRLQILNAAHNSLSGGGSPLPQRRGDAAVSVPCCTEVWNLDLSYNEFCNFPNWIMRFPSLKILNLSGNPQIHRLPADLLSQMTHLTSLSVDSAHLHDPPPVVGKRGPADLLRYLQLKKHSSQVWSCVRVVVVGPQGSGKSQLVSKVREDKVVPSGPTKGLEVTEWKHRAADFFPFKSKTTTIDFWDFSGDHNYHIIYSSFRCCSSMHLLVFNSQEFDKSDILRWLAGIQATSRERIPVVLVFTHLDKFPSRDARESYKRRVVQWLHSWQQGVHRGHSQFFAPLPQSVKNIFGDDLASSLEAPPTKSSAAAATGEEVDSQQTDDLPLLPNIHRVYFVNAVSGDGVGPLRKCLVKIASGSLAPELTGFSGFRMIGREVPAVYGQVELLLRHLRGRFRSLRREGEQRPFYTISELVQKKLRRPLTEGGIMERDFVAALNFLHEYGLVYMHKCKSPAATLVSIDPQLVGYLLQRMIRAGLVTKEVNPTSCYLPNSHIFMLWGVEPVWSRELEQGVDTIHSQHLLDFLHHLNLCSPLLPGLTLLPSILPTRLPSPLHPSPSHTLRCRRVYLFGFFPRDFFPQLVSRVVSNFLANSRVTTSPISPGHAPSGNLSVPFEMEGGHLLYLWENNLFLRHESDGQMLVKLLEGVAVCPGAVPHEARIDILLDAPPAIEAHWLRVVTTEIDHLLGHAYPGLLESEFSGRLVEIYVPFPFEGEGELCDNGEGVRMGDGDEVDLVMSDEVEREKEGREEDDVFEVGTPIHSKPSPGGGASPREMGEVNVGSPVKKGGCEGVRGVPVVGSLQSNVSSGSLRQRLQIEHTNDTSSWEIISKHSSTSTRFSFKTDTSSSHFLVPVWECLTAAFKSPVIRVNNRKVRLDNLVPDLLFGDVPPELILRIHDDLILDSPAHSGNMTTPTWNGTETAIVRQSGMGTSMHQAKRISLPEWNGMETSQSNRKRSHTIDGVQTWNGIGTQVSGMGTQVSGMGPSQSGMCVRTYYSSEDEEDCAQKDSGTARMLSLKRCLQKARDDLERLRQLQCPYIVSAIGVHFSPPSLAVESSPLGSLQQYLREKDKGLVEIGSTTIHHILLQLLSALEYFHREGLNYHTLQSENVLLWSMDPVSIKLSDSGITHNPRGCRLCSYIRSVPLKQRRKPLANRIDYMLLGLLIYEIATGNRPYEHIHSLSTVVLALLHNRITLNVEAELENSSKKKKKNQEQKTQCTVSCHRLCMQTAIEQCILSERVASSFLRSRLSLCAGNQTWSPLRLTLNPECLLCSEEADLVYWTSGSRGLVTGTLNVHTGELNSNILQETPKPESGMFMKRIPKPVPIAVGRTTALTLVEETQQLWVGAENGERGFVYVFKLPDMRTHHYIHLQDAVLSLVAFNKSPVKFGGDSMKYRVLVGLANGAVILFLGVHAGRILENPLQGPKHMVHLGGRRPCIAMQLTAQGHVWCSSGPDVEILDTVTLRSIRKVSLSCHALPEEKGIPPPRSDVITLLRVNWYGVWTVGRRSPILRLWNQESGALISQYNIHDALSGNDDYITAMSLHGKGVWLGTRNGYLFLLDSAAVEEGRDSCHLGLQHCGEGKIKNIVPLVSSRHISAKLEVLCSLEFPDEVSGSVMMWSYQCQQQWRPKPSPSRSQSAPLPPLSASS